VLNIHNAEFEIPIKKFGRTVDTRTILKGVSLKMYSGETVAVMGPSGAGKTTLMDLLTMEGAGGTRTGHVDLNGETMTDAVFKKYCAYVGQSDRGWAFLTCRESLEFAAKCFVRGTAPEKAERVDELIRTMGLEACQHNKVGNEFLKGLSGGQQRRLSLACAFLKDPLVIFLDEVTSGLDAAAAAHITSFMQQLARSKDVIIACTIHQPSAKVFKGFDQLLLLSGGHAAYSGQVCEVEQYFKSLGFEVPLQENPADFLLDAVNADFTEPDVVARVVQAWGANFAPLNSTGTAQVDPKSKRKATSSLCHQISVLLQRTVVLAMRDPTAYISRLVVCLFACCFFSLVYLKSRERTQDQVMNRMWLIVWHLGVPAQMSVAMCLGQNIEFASVRREVKAGMYNFSAYFIAQFLFQIPYLLLLSSFCISVSGYAIGNWNIDGFLPSVFVHALFMLTFECVAQFHAVQFSHPLLGMLGVVNFWFASFLFGGILVPLEDVIWPLRALGYISPINYGIKALMNLELKGTTWSGAELQSGSVRGFYCPGNPVACFGVTGDQILATMSALAAGVPQNVKVESELLQDCISLLAIAALFKIAFYVVALMKCYDGKEVKPKASAPALQGKLPTLLKPDAPKVRETPPENEAEANV
jgi:ABC-type multidrug transport system ATPase subunit